MRQIIIIANGINSRTPKLQTALARMLTMYVVGMMMYCGCTIVNMVSGDDDDDVDDGVDDEAGENDDALRLHHRQHGEW